MLFTKQKLHQRVMELGGKRYCECKNIAPFTAMEDTLSKDEHHTKVPERIEGGTLDINDMFVGLDRYLWIEKKVVLPQPKEGYEVVGLFNFGVTGHGGNRGFESMLYVDKEPYQGVDTNHGEVIFSGLGGKEVTLTFMLWTGMEGVEISGPFYHQCKVAQLGYLHKKADELYFFSRAIIESLDWMEEDSPYYDKLLTALDRALVPIDWDGENFYETVDAAHATLMAELDKLEKNTDVTVHAIGHTHIDVAWLWRLKHTREKAQRSFATVLRLMEQYDEYVFLQTQPQLYKYIKEDCPQMYEKIKQKVAEGKWEAAGGMWVEADCNLSSGESLVRQLLYGTRFYEEEFGKKCEYLWLPDVFGYSWALPQILKQCEIETFMTTKISWNQYNTIPDDLFKWKGIDGTEILTYFVDTPEVGFSPKERFSTYNGLITPHAVIGNWKKFKNKSLTHDTLLSYGYGDGGGGVNRDMLETRRALDKIPGVPNLKTDQATDFFRNLHSQVDDTDRYIHTWDGELYLEYHRGTYTTQGYNKKMNRYLEHKLGQMEFLSSAAYILGGDYARDELHDAWETVLLHQFHDVIPGSSIREVYEDSHINYDRANAQAEKAGKKALETLLESKEHVYTVYSTNSFAGQELVLVPEKEDGIFTDAEGNVLEAQKTENGYEVLVETRPFGANVIEFTPGESWIQDSAFVIRDGAIDTPFYTICWNAGGQLTRIYDKEAEREVLCEGMEGNVLELYEDKPMANDAWDIDIYYTEKMTKLCADAAPEVLENGALRAVLRFRYSQNKSSFVENMILYKDSRRIDFKLHADWKEDHKLLKVAFYPEIRSTRATYDIQFGHAERPTHWNNSWDWAKFEVVGHKWADLSETGYGVSLLNDCKYGYSIKDNAMKLSLLRAPKNPDYAADMEEHDITYALYPHLGSVTDGGTIEQANALNLPAQVVAGRWKDARRLVSVSDSCVQIDAVKKAEDEDCLIVRLHECRGGMGKVTLTSDYPVRRIIPCNLLEHDTGDGIEASKIAMTFKPFEIKTLKLYL